MRCRSRRWWVRLWCRLFGPNVVVLDQANNAHSFNCARCWNCRTLHFLEVMGPFKKGKEDD